MSHARRHLPALLVGVVLACVPLATAPEPTTVTIVGSFQNELGCPGDWQPDCAGTHLAFDADDGVWQGAFAVPAGSWEYKAALDDSWDENYGSDATRDGPNIPLDLAAPGDVKFYYSHATHWITDDVNAVIATVPGSFQDELGCPGDWQPECLRSWLQDPDGDGLYGFSTDAIPAGDYEAKVAHDEGWAENYGAGGVANGANIPFSVPDGATVEFEYDPVTHLLTISTGGTSDDDAALVRPSVRSPFADEVLYFVLPDRFANGDEVNDRGGDTSGDPLVHGFLPTYKGYYHGGDLAGLMGELDYLQGLGVSAIVMTPPLVNRAVQGDGTIPGSSAGYHGYWPTDFTGVDPHLGSGPEFQALIDEAHAREIKVFMDVVTNHTADVLSYAEGIFAYRSKEDFPYLDVSGTPFDDADYAGGDVFPPLDPAISFPYTPIFPAMGDATVKSPAWLNDPIYYHNRGNSTFTGENSLYGDFFGLDDLWTEHPTVVEGMIDVYRNLVTAFRVDGFRLDSVKHVNDEFWVQFVPEILAHAGAEGIPDFFVFGEVFDTDPAITSRYTTQLPLPSVLDFGFAQAARQFAARGGSSNGLRDFFASDDHYTDADSNAYALATFVGNHDMGRIGWDLDTANPGAADTERLARSRLAHALLLFSRGAPVIYYGDEQGFTGDGGDADARQDMLPSQVASYNDDDLIGTAATTADDNFDPTHPLYQAIGELAALRNAHVALRRGAQLHRYSEPGPGIYAFSRIERSEQVEYLVVFNNGESDAMASFPTASPSTTFTALAPAGAPPLSSDPAGGVTVDVPALDFAVYRADAPLPPSLAAPAIEITTPGEGEQVTGRVEVGASVGGNTYAEVTFAVSVDGGAYDVVGTDDNPPYRVFYDVEPLPEGTMLEFRAIVDDLSGHLAADQTSAVVGPQEEPPMGGPAYAIVHYFRDDGDYGDHTTGDFNDFWGLHLWGPGIDPSEATEWTNPEPFLGEDAYGRFAWVKLVPGATEVDFIVHRGDVKDGTDLDRSFDPSLNPEIWLKGGDGAEYPSQAEAQGFVTLHYHRDDGDYGDPSSGDFNDFWGVHLWGDAIEPSEATGWTLPKRPTGFDDYGAFFQVAIQDASQPVWFILHRGDTKDPGPDQSLDPLDTPTVWIQSGDETLYPQRGAAEDFVTLHYHRDDADYGNPASSDFNDFWGMHVWTGAASPNPSWQDPVRPLAQDLFGITFRVDLAPGATELAYILHRGDAKDPGPDQFLDLASDGHEVWQLEGADPENPYILPISFGFEPPPPVPGDIDGDGDVDSDDVALVFSARGTAAAGPDDPRDLDGDGLITVGDARALALLCTRPACATE